MATINTKVVSIRVYATDDSIKYRVVFDQTFIGMVKDKETGEFIEREINYVDFIPRVFIAQCLDAVDGLALLYTKKKEQGLRTDRQNGFGAAELQVVLKDAKITLEREKFEIGDEYTDNDDVVHQRDHAGYSTNVSEVVVTERVQQKLDAMIDKMFDF